MRRTYCFALAACFLSAPSFAQSAPTGEELPSAQDLASRDTVTVGLGGAYVPDYEGSDDYRVIPAVAVRGKVSGFSFSTRGSYFYFDVIPHRTAAKVEINFGPVIGERLNSRRHIKDEIVRLLPKRKRAIEAGAFGGISFHGLLDPYDTLSLRLDLLHDITNAHKSTVFSPTAEFATPLSRKTYASLSLGTDFVSNKFADYYYSISPADSVASGLPVFDARGGMKDWRAALLLNQSITGDLLGGLSVFGLGQYSRLLGDFRRSPIVSQRGSANQWIGAAGLAYTW